MTETADYLIARSISHDEIAHGDYSPGLMNELRDACDDCVETDQTVEFWGVKGGSSWRVHLHNT